MARRKLAGTETWPRSVNNESFMAEAIMWIHHVNLGNGGDGR